MNDEQIRLGPDDDPQQSGALVAVHYGDYRRQEVWVASGANIGNWYPLGGEFWVVWDRERMPAGVTQQHPTWEDVLARGPVTLLMPAASTVAHPGFEYAYRAGWQAGWRALWKQLETVGREVPEPR